MNGKLGQLEADVATQCIGNAGRDRNVVLLELLQTEKRFFEVGVGNSFLSKRRVEGKMRCVN